MSIRAGMTGDYYSDPRVAIKKSLNPKPYTTSGGPRSKGGGPRI